VNKKFCLVIPARLNSSRFPQKVLAHYNGHSLLENSLKIADNIKNYLDVDIVVASDFLNDEIIKLCGKYDALPFLMNNSMYPEVTCGSERVKHVYSYNPIYDYYVTLPIDEPTINPKEVIRALLLINNESIYTLWSKFFCYEDIVSKYSCKMIIEDGKVIYTSRAVIPSSKDVEHDLDIYKKHVGVFIFPNKILEKYSKAIWNSQSSAILESLEQNMFIGREFDFKAIEIKHNGFGIDSPEQIIQLEKRFSDK